MIIIESLLIDDLICEVIPVTRQYQMFAQWWWLVYSVCLEPEDSLTLDGSSLTQVTGTHWDTLRPSLSGHGEPGSYSPVCCRGIVSSKNRKEYFIYLLLFIPTPPWRTSVS